MAIETKPLPGGGLVKQRRIPCTAFLCMSSHTFRLAVMLITAMLLPIGCSTPSATEAFSDVHRQVSDRIQQDILWNQSGENATKIAAEVDRLLQLPMDDASAVRIALLNNRQLQAAYQSLGIAVADLRQATLLPNPVFSGDIKFAVHGRGEIVDLSLVGNVVDLLLSHVRKKLAQDQLERVRTQVTLAVIVQASRARVALAEAQAAQQALVIQQAICQAAEATADFFKRLHDAGNVNDLMFAVQQVDLQQAKLELSRAEIENSDAREKLIGELGLWGRETVFSLAPLPDVPAENNPAGDVERQAIEKSLDLAAARSDVMVAARELGVQDRLGLFSEIDLGVASEREFTEGWGVGPALSLPIPLFDQGQARLAGDSAKLERARQLYYATAVAVRSAARVAQRHVLTDQARVQFIEKTILPLRQQITRETLLHYNGMLVGTDQLLRARQDESAAQLQHLRAVRDYWISRAKLDQLLAGSMPAQMFSTQQEMP